MTLKSYLEKIGKQPVKNPKTEKIKEIASACGVTTSTVYRWISGVSKPDKLQLERIAQLTGLTENELFK